MLLFVGVLWSVAVWVTAENHADQPEWFFPNCDLVSVSYVNIEKNENGTLDISYSWTRKEESYALIDEPITRYMVRHGPLLDDQPTNESKIMMAAPDEDAVILKDVIPCDKYFIQICAVGERYFMFQEDLWDHAWRGWIGLGPYKEKEETAVTKPPFDPRCDLLQTRETSFIINEDSGMFTVWFTWNKKESSYKSIGTFDYYLVRHGPVYGGGINESVANYMYWDNDTTVISVKGTYFGCTYGFQLCAVNASVGFFYREPMDWKEKAGLVAVDFRRSCEDFGTPPPLDNGDPIREILLKDVDMFNVSGEVAPKPTSESFAPRCDLVDHGFVSVRAAPDDKTLLVNLTWVKKRSSYDQLGGFEYYAVRYGPWSDVEGISEPYSNELSHPSDARDTDFFLVRDIPPRSTFFIQICAVSGGESVNWTDAWTGVIRTTHYESYARTKGWTVDMVISEDSTPVLIPPKKSYSPWCNLVKKSYVTAMAADQETKTVTVNFAWEKNAASYSAIGPIHHYLVLHGPMRGGAIDVALAHQFFSYIEPKDIQMNIPFGSMYGVSICARTPYDDNTPDTSIDWRNDAWLGRLDFTNYHKQGDSWFNVDMEELEDPTLQDSQDGAGLASWTNEVADADDGPIVTQIAERIDYDIVLLVASILGVILITVSCCTALFFIRRRRQVKTVEKKQPVMLP